MSLWLTRAGRYGEYEQRFLENKKVYLTWDVLNRDLSKVATIEELREILKEIYPDVKKGQLINNSGQIWTFVHRMEVGDWIVLPSKHKPAMHIAEIKGAYKFDESAPDPFYHYRKVAWIGTDIPRTNFDQDLLYSFGAAMTICEIKRNGAENRVRAMAESGWKPSGLPKHAIKEEEGEEVEGDLVNIEEIARDQIAKLIIAQYKGHGMARLVNGILRAQGYTTYISPAGPDKGIDILAASGPLGFGQPRICVQVKSGDSPLDRPTLDQLIGTMQNVQAQQGLLVSWGGFKSSIDKEEASQFFRVRLWDQDDLVNNLLTHYDKLDDDIRTELPLKRIWIVSGLEGE